MSHDVTATLARGETLYGTSRTIDSNNLEGANLLGLEKTFPDTDLTASSSAVQSVRTTRYVTCRLVRNTSGITLLPKDFVKLNDLGTEATGRASLDSEHGYPADEWLPSAGVRANDVFYVVVDGPAMMKTPNTAGVADIAVGERLHSLTSTAGSTQTGTTSDAGRVSTFVVAAATTTAQFDAREAFHANWVGVALTARTTGNTGADILVNVRRRW